MVLGADLNGHVGEETIGYKEIMGRCDAGTRNKERSIVVDGVCIWRFPTLILRKKTNTG